MRIFIVVLMCLGLSMNCFADSIDLPAVKAGDNWTYLTTNEIGANGWSQSNDKITVSRVTATSIYYTMQQAGSTRPPKEVVAGIDWSRLRDVNGKEMTVNQPLSFPLSTGKTWTVEYTEQHPNKVHKFEHWNSKATVIGYETVKVPAGKFNALKIEMEGQWSAELEPSQTVIQGAQTTQNSTTMVTQAQKIGATPVTGRLYKAFWYAPKIKRWVKSIEEYYGNNGVRSERHTGELESFIFAK
ncbi:hypothetical protein [Sideroxydans sp. CL21]|uniref:hypothetical protein n=1 Tax=Sideroxydans sp. CL21 TaxID=2600596 RepID=UPI0012A81473|nr:hypothetical protein [Sideroxydans sp. CL21]VVC84774.1 hypothetical protein [Sideroxydans sp. CL21]